MKCKPCCAEAVEACALAADMIANKYDADASRHCMCVADLKDAITSKNKADVARECAAEIRRLLKITPK